MTSARPRRHLLTLERGHSYPAELTEFAGFADSSYGNDVTDSVVLAVGDRAITVWVDHADPAERHRDFGWNPELPLSESNQPPRRFVVCALVDGDPDRRHRTAAPTLQELLDEREISDGEPLMETDDPSELIAYLRTLS